jgi:hypothetical protein
MAITKIPAAGFTGNNFRNIIINGDMSIAQRGTSATGITGTSYNTVDRFENNISSFGTWTQSQETDAPTGQGFVKSLKMECTTANASLSASDVINIRTKFEGQNLQYLKKGTSNAESLTLSFWLKSSTTGTYICEFRDVDNNRSISKSYTIDTADTWEKKTLTFSGDTTGAFDNDNARSMDLYFYLGAGSNYSSGTLNTSWNTRTLTDVAVGQVNLGSTIGNYWQITGVQLEAGTTASDFEFLPVDVNLDRCQRYYQFIGAGANYSAIGGANDTPICNASSYNGASAYGVLDFTTTMRSAPSLDQVTGGNYYRYYNSNSSDYFDSFNLAGATSTKRALFNNVDAMTISAGQAGWFAILNDASYVALDSEL